MHHAVGADAIAGPGLRDEAVLQLAARVALVADPQFSARFPAERVAQVILVLNDGTTLRSEPTAARGGADSPLSDAEVSAKFHRLAASLRSERRHQIEDEVDRLDCGGNVPALLDVALEPV